MHFDRTISLEKVRRTNFDAKEERRGGITNRESVKSRGKVGAWKGFQIFSSFFSRLLVVYLPASAIRIPDV
jgi:hypothetical protein